MASYLKSAIKGNDRQTKDCTLQSKHANTVGLEFSWYTSPITELDPTTLAKSKVEQDFWSGLPPHLFRPHKYFYMRSILSQFLHFQK